MKNDAFKILPIQNGNLIIRKLEEEDLMLRANWPSYPASFAVFNSSLKNIEEIKVKFNKINNDENQICIAIDYNAIKSIGYISIREIDWSTGTANNMGIRIHPNWCNQGIGKIAIDEIGKLLKQIGVKTIKLDVSIQNQRAIKCYEKCNFQKVSEFDRTDERTGAIGKFIWMTLKP